MTKPKEDQIDAKIVARAEVTIAGSLEMEEVQCSGGKLAGMPVFYKQGYGTSAFVLRAFDADGKPMRTALVRLSSDGTFTLADRTHRITAQKSEAQS